MGRFRGAVVAGFVLAMLGGCSQDDGPKYATPQGKASDLALLKGTWGTYVCKVDGENVSGGSGYTIFGGSSATVTPGTHELLVVVDTDSGAPAAAPAKPGISLQMSYSNSDGINRFPFDCEKGHTYEFSRRGLFNQKLKVTDKNTGRTMEIEDMGAP